MAEGEASVELRVQGDRAVLTDRDAPDLPAVAPERLPLGPDLTAALHEWARVASAVRKASLGQSAALAEQDEDAVGVVSRRGRQLAGRIASEMRTSVHYVDPVTEVATVVVPEPMSAVRRGPRHARPDGSALFRRTPGEPVPWGPGLTISAFMLAVVFVGMLALSSTLARETNAWLAVLASLLVTGGMAPSLWLGRGVPIMRWVCLGAAAGLALSWVGLLFVL